MSYMSYMDTHISDKIRMINKPKTATFNGNNELINNYPYSLVVVQYGHRLYSESIPESVP